MFEDAFKEIIGHEGGYVNDPADPGGETKYGISKRAYPDLDIAALTLDDAHAIYKRDYWDINRCDEMPWHAALLIFDCGVNQGVRTAAKLAQRSIGAADDGIIGSRSLAAIAAKPATEFISDFGSRRLKRYAALPTFGRFGRGWSKRVLDLSLKAAAK